MSGAQASRKALIVGPIFHNYNQSIARALASVGFNTHIIDFPNANPTGMVNRVRIDAAKKIGIVRYEKAWRRDFNEKLLETYRAFAPDLLLVIKGTWIDQSTLEQMQSSFKVVWLHDQAYRSDGFMSTKEYYDEIFVFEGSDVALLKEKFGITAHFLPMGFDPAIYRPMPEVAKDIDIGFVGFPYRHRRETIERLLGDFPDLTIRVYGRYVRYREPDSWARFISHQFDSRRRRTYVNREITPTEVSRLYARSKIALNIHHGQSREGCNPRVFEIMGSGTFQLVDAIPFLREHTDWGLCLYESYEQLRDLITRYIGDAEARRVFEARALEVSSQHTFLARITQMLETCQMDATAGANQTDGTESLGRS